jgi:hypothetical protein
MWPNVSAAAQQRHKSVVHTQPWLLAGVVASAAAAPPGPEPVDAHHHLDTLCILMGDNDIVILRRPLQVHSSQR